MLAKLLRRLVPALLLVAVWTYLDPFASLPRRPLPPPRSVSGPFEPGADFLPLPSQHVARAGRLHQSLDAFRQERRATEDSRRVLYLEPLGWPEATSYPLLGSLESHARAFFQRELRVLPGSSIEARQFTTRFRPSLGWSQVLVPDVLDSLRPRLPDDALGLVAITAQDLYPEPSWNFVFGQADPANAVSVLSLARYHPAGPKQAILPQGSWLTAELPPAGTPAPSPQDALAATRALKVFTSQICFLLGFRHCVRYACGLNWTDGMRQLDARPLHLCPLCLEKLHDSLGFDIHSRYQELQASYSRLGLTEEADWISRRLKALAPPP